MGLLKRRKPWYVIENKGNKRVAIDILDNIGSSFFDEGTTVKGFKKRLDSAGDVSDIDLTINSNGGDAFQGFAIFELLKNHKAKVHVTIIGLAASISGVIAMSGDDIQIASNGFFMVHLPRGMAFGTSKEMRKNADLLDKVEDNIVDTFEARVSIPRNGIIDLVKEETWMNAKEAVEKGFADSIIQKAPVENFIGNRYNAFNHIPEQIQQLIEGGEIEEEIQYVALNQFEETRNKEKEMTKEEFDALFEEKIKPIQNELNTQKELTAKAQKELEDYKTQNATESETERQSDYLRRLNGCVSNHLISAKERDSAVKIVAKLQTEDAEEYISGLESREVSNVGILMTELTSENGENASSVISKNYSLPVKDGTGRFNGPTNLSLVKAFDEIDKISENEDDFRKNVYAAHGERAPGKIVLQ